MIICKHNVTACILTPLKGQRNIYHAPSSFLSNSNLKITIWIESSQIRPDSGLFGYTTLSYPTKCLLPLFRFFLALLFLPETKICHVNASEYITVVSGISDSGITDNSAYSTKGLRSLGFSYLRHALKSGITDIRHIRYSRLPTCFLSPLG